MALLTKTYSKKPLDRQKLVLIVTIIISFIIGIIAGYEFGAVPYHLFHDDMIEPSWLVFGITTALCLFFGGLINGIIKRLR